MKTGNKKNNKLNVKNNLSVQDPGPEQYQEQSTTAAAAIRSPGSVQATTGFVQAGSVQAAGSVQETAKKKRGRPSKAVQQQQQQSVSVSVQDNIDIRKRGRPKGSKNKAIRKDREIIMDKNTNNRYLHHGMQLMKLARIDLNNDKAVQDRIEYYFTLCEEQDIRPSVAGLAFAFGMSRITLFSWLNGIRGKLTNENSVNSIKAAYNYINLYYENMMNNGNINPVAGIFLMKNNMGYKDNTDLTITANQDKQDTISDITNRANLLD